jgi:hypothetical protein
VNSVLTKTSTLLNYSVIGSGLGTLDTSLQATVHVRSEYFTTSSSLAAESDINYLVSPIEQIRDQINKWFSSIGKKTYLQCEDTTWVVVAPARQIPAEFFESYEPFFTAVHHYQASVSGVDDCDGSKSPSDLQITAALLGMANLMAALAPAPSPMFLEDGTIGGYWRRKQYYVSIDFEVDGEHTWVGTDGEVFHSGTWKLPGNPMPPALTNELRAIFAK